MPSKTKTILVAIFLVIVLALQAFASNDRPAGKKDSLAEQSITLATGVTLRYVEQGNMKSTPIIFLHGYTDSWRSFENVMLQFPKAAHVIAISQRGHGNSDRPDTYTLKQFAGDLAQFISQKRLGPCVIVGHSLGGLVTQQFAIDYPWLTRGIIIESSGPSFADNEGIPEFLSEVMKLADPVDRGFAEAFQASTVAKPLARDIINVYVDETGKVPARVWKSIAAEIIKAGYSRDLQNINVPALILWGTNDAFCSRADQDQLLKGITSSKLIIYEGFGHALHWECPSRFVKDVWAFVKSSPQ